ncbi:MAG: cbb3-type cytochrome oxidase assembly protein CcoS [SAR324 cluster bacterium]|nr:cbb3-type cytochrome oxidase assembly protein CcoS [SAR324 cluster bacterium]
MSVIYFLIPVSLVLGGGTLLLFIWALRSGQFDDLQTPAYRILFSDGEEKSDLNNHSDRRKHDNNGDLSV